MVRSITHRRPTGHLLFRINNIIRTVAQQELCMDIPRRPGQHKGRTVLLQQGGGLQRTLKIVSNSHHTQVKIPDAQGGDELLVGAVSDLGVGHQGQNVIYTLFVAVHGQHLMAQFPQLFRHVAAETPETDQKHRFHMYAPFILPLPVLVEIVRKSPCCQP